jgi:iron complex outermembrane receptor protein
VPGDPRPAVGDPAVNDSTTLSVAYRDTQLGGGELTLQGYVQDYEALFEGGAFTTFALTIGGPAFLDQSAITSDKIGVKATWTRPNRPVWGWTPAIGLDISSDTSAQRLARTNRLWVPETTLREVAPFVQLQRALGQRLLVSGGVRAGIAALQVDDFTTLPSARSTFVAGGRPTFTELLPNLGLVYYATPRLSTYASFSEGFTMPDVGRVLRAVSTQGLDVDTLVDVEPVVTGNLEVGADYRLPRAQLHLAYYRSNSDRGSLLERTADSQVFAVRREKTAIDGIDASLEVPVSRAWSAGGTVSWLRGRFDADRDGRVDSDLDGLNLSPGRVNLFVQGQAFAPLSVRVQVSTLRDRTVRGRSVPPHGATFDGYTLVDLALGLPTRAGTFRLAVENLLDRQYVLYFSQVDTGGGNDTFFAGPGRGVVLSFERRF